MKMVQRGLLWITFAALMSATSGGVGAATVRLAASTPLSAFADPLGLDVGTGILPAIMDGLTRIGPDGAIEPALAVSWRAESDTRWVFEVRPNVIFSDGTPCDAAAVAAYFNLLAGPEGRGAPIASEVDGIVGARVLGPLTVEITTRAKDVRLPRKLKRAHIFSATAFAALGRVAFAKSPIGTGPYRATAWAMGGSGVTLVGVPTSWRAPEQIDRVEVKIIPDRSSRLQSLLADETDIASNLDPDSIETLVQAGLRAHVQAGPVILALAFRNGGDAAPALQDRRVRLALNLAVDRNAIARDLLAGTAEVATQIATPDVVGYDPGISAYPYDVARARGLLADAGYPNGFAITAGVFGGQIPGDTAVFQRVAQDLAVVGVRLELRQLPFSEFSRRTQSGQWGEFDVFSGVWSHYGLGDISRSAERHSCLHSTPWFCEAEVTPLIQSANDEMDLVVRAQRLRAVTAVFHDVVPSLLLTRYASIDGLSRRVAHYETVIDAIMFGKMRVRD